MREKWPTIVIAVAVGLVLLTYLVVFQVRINETAVHYRWGAVLRQINAGQKTEEAGWYFKLPWPVDKVITYDKRVHVLDGQLAQTELQDNWNVLISMFAGWRVSDPVSFKKTLRGDTRSAETKLKDILLDITVQTVGKVTIDNLVSTDPEQLELDLIEDRITESVRQAVKRNGYGIEVCSFGIRRVAIPQETTREVFQRMRDERETYATRFRSEGQRRKAEIVAEARTEAEKMVSQARADAKSIRAEGEAAEAEYFDVFAQAPELHNFLRRLESLATIAEKAKENGQSITFVLSTENEPFGIFQRGPSGSATEKKEEEDTEEEETRPASEKVADVKAEERGE